MKKFNTPANTLFTEPLSQTLTPSEITIQFINDYKLWNDYAFAESKKEMDKDEQKWNIGKSYDNLIIKYCGTDKKYQGLSYGSDAFDANSHAITNEVIDKNTAIVLVHFTNPQFDFIEHDFEFHFTNNGTQWLLTEKYLIDDDGKHPYL